MKCALITISLLLPVEVMAGTAPPVSLKPEMFVDYSFSLVSETQVEQYIFGKDGSVGACFGTKGGGVAGPVFHWKIESGTKLRITDTPEGTNSVNISFEFSSITDKTATTTDGRKFTKERTSKVGQDEPGKGGNSPARF